MALMEDFVVESSSMNATKQSILLRTGSFQCSSEVKTGWASRKDTKKNRNLKRRQATGSGQLYTCI